VARRRAEAATVALLVAGLVVLAAGCGGASRQRQAAMMTADEGGQRATAPPLDPEAVASHRLSPGDLIDIKFAFHPEENERVPVRPDGRISLQSTGDIQAAGVAVKDLERIVADKAAAKLRGPVVSIVLVQLAEHKVFVGGQVLKPGFVIFRIGMTPLQAIVERGGFAADAKLDEIVHLHRVGAQVETRKLDLRPEVEGDGTGPVALGPNDIIIVPRSFIGKADVFVDQYIRGLLPSIPQPGLDLPLLFF
jgi:polysaccharide export outer membrane protein